MKFLHGTLLAIVAATGLAAPVWAQAPAAQESIARPIEAEELNRLNASRQSEGAGGRAFGNLCLNCHYAGNTQSAPDPAALKQMTPEQLYRSMTTGNMATISKDIPDDTKREIAIFVSGRRLLEAANAEARAMPNLCESSRPIQSLTATPAWNGWGVDLSNTRFQPAEAAGLSAGQVSRLQLKWAFALPGATAVYGQPTVVDGRVFVSSDAGHVYSLDAATGCVHWSFQAQAAVRNAITVGPRGESRDQFAAYFGDIRGNMYALDPSTGELLWKVAIDAHPLARITGSPVLHEGRLYVPVASLEEVESGSPNYICCTFRGMLATLDADTGQQIWKTYTISQTPEVVRQNSLGKPYMGPSGAGVWDTPTIDPKRRVVYIATGNNFSEPATDTSNAIMALSMETGEVLWSFQANANDVWHEGCGRGLGQGRQMRQREGAGEGHVPYPVENCPVNGGPDQDFSGGVILKPLLEGRNILIAGQKPGLVWALDPDNNGALLWKEDVARASANRGIIFGGAADDQYAYFALKSGGILAVDLNTGLEKWYVDVPTQESMKNHPGVTAAVTAIPGVVFTAGLDGMLRAFAAFDGRALWEFNTAQDFKTVNGLPARGGSIGQAGATVAQGMVFVGSGYTGFQGGVPGNVLLAFEAPPAVPPYY